MCKRCSESPIAVTIVDSDFNIKSSDIFHGQNLIDAIPAEQFGALMQMSAQLKETGRSVMHWLILKGHEYQVQMYYTKKSDNIWLAFEDLGAV